MLGEREVAPALGHPALPHQLGQDRAKGGRGQAELALQLLARHSSSERVGLVIAGQMAGCALGQRPPGAGGKEPGAGPPRLELGEAGWRGQRRFQERRLGDAAGVLGQLLLEHAALESPLE